MTDIALDKRAKFAAQLRNAANEMRAEDHNGWPVLCDIVADYLDASPSQVAPANPAQVTDAMVEAARDICVRDVGVEAPSRDTIKDALTAAIGAGGQAVAEPTGFIDHHRQKFASVEKHDANTLRKSGWTPVYAQPHPTDERVEPTEGVSNKAVEGRKAYKAGQPKGSNPYPQGTARYWQWSSGWLDEQAFRPRPDERVVEALEWYAVQVAGCRKVTSEGNDARAALNNDGGERARVALSAREGR